MRPHHEEAIRKITEHYSEKGDCLALIVVGSIAKGLERDDSDVDVMMVVSDERYEELKAQNQLMFWNNDLCDYASGYVDGKCTSLSFIQMAAERANEPTRAAFSGAIVTHSRVPGLEEMVARIPRYQAQEKQAKIQSFWAHFEAAYWYLGEALRWEDKYLLTRAVADLVLFAGRLILAHNEILYPYHKHLRAAIGKAPEKPERFLELMDDLLANPNTETARAFHDPVALYRNWNEAQELWANRFHQDTELAWIAGRAYVGDF